MVELPAVARRVDRGGGYWEEAAFLDFGGAPVFVVTHIPERDPLLGVVVCSSILVEHLTNYRREVMLARALASRGIAVLRFHYRGTGHSGGDEMRMTVESMVEDTLAAAKALGNRTGVLSRAFVGTRWGAIPAAAAAGRDHPGSPVVLWEPVVDAERYFREMSRARRIAELRDDLSMPSSRSGGPLVEAVPLAREFEQRGWAEVLGFTLPQSLYTSALGARLDTLLARLTGPILLIQIGPGEKVRAEFADIRERVPPPARMEIHLVRDEPGWLFTGNELHSAEELAIITGNWLLAPRAPDRSDVAERGDRA